MPWSAVAAILAALAAVVVALVAHGIVTRLSLRESQSRYRALYEDNRAVMLVSDAESGQVLDANRAALDFYGWSIAQIREKRIWDINIGGEPAVAEVLGTLPRSQESFLTRQRTADGSVRDVEVFASHASVRGRLLLYSIVHDVTARRLVDRELDQYRRNLEALVEARTAELIETNRQLREANDTKSRFMADMSHEFRTPLNSVIGFSSTLGNGLAGELNDEQQTQVDMIHRSGLRLLELVDTLLDMAALDRKSAIVVLEETDCIALARDALESIRPLAVHKGLRLLDRLPQAGCVIVTDPAKVRQILANLVGNAVKFTEKGSVSVEFESGTDEVRLIVADTGPGIPAERWTDIFEGFRQMEIPGIAKPAGSGLGLTVSQALAGMLGARIELNSAVGHGSTFTLALPIQARTRAEELSGAQAG